MAATSISRNNQASSKLHYIKEKKEQSTKLNKSDLIEDLFNNSNDFDEKNARKQPVRLYLSKSSQLLHNNLKERIREFLANNRDVEKALQKIDLLEEEMHHLSKQSALNVKRLRLYANWLSIHENQDANTMDKLVEEETPYHIVHRIGKNEQIKAIYEQQKQEVDFVKQKQMQALPTYYYVIHPETYAFN